MLPLKSTKTKRAKKKKKNKTAAKNKTTSHKSLKYRIQMIS